MQIKHRDLTPAGVTGNLSADAFLEEGPLNCLPTRAQWALWGGCIDAPDAIVIGGCLAVNTGGMAHGLGYEGTTPRVAIRGA